MLGARPAVGCRKAGSSSWSVAGVGTCCGALPVPVSLRGRSLQRRLGEARAGPGAGWRRSRGAGRGGGSSLAGWAGAGAGPAGRASAESTAPKAAWGRRTSGVSQEVVEPSSTFPRRIAHPLVLSCPSLRSSFQQTKTLFTLIMEDFVGRYTGVPKAKGNLQYEMEILLPNVAGSQK